MIPAALVCLLVVTLVVGSSCSREQSGRKPEDERPTRSPFAQLRERPLKPPELRAGAPCPDPRSRDVALLPPGIPAEVGRGTGPVYFVVAAAPRFLDFFAQDSPAEASRWRSAETLWLSEPGYRGPVLVRGRAVEGEARVGFGAAERPEFELRLSAGTWEQRTRFLIWGRYVRVPDGWRAGIVSLRVQEGGCYFLQIDGQTFTERSLFGAISQGG